MRLFTLLAVSYKVFYQWLAAPAALLFFAYVLKLLNRIGVLAGSTPEGVGVP